MRRLQIISSAKTLCRLISFFLTFQIIFLLPKVRIGALLELAQVKFKWGLANYFDLIDAETELRSAQTNLLSAVINYIAGTNQMRASMETLLERPEKF